MPFNVPSNPENPVNPVENNSPTESGQDLRDSQDSEGKNPVPPVEENGPTVKRSNGPTFAVAGTDLRAGDVVTLPNGERLYVSRTGGFGQALLQGGSRSLPTLLQGDGTLDVVSVVRGGRDISAELKARDAGRRRETGLGEFAADPAETARLSKLAERIEARFPKSSSFGGIRVVVEGAEGARGAVSEETRRIYAEQLAVNRKAGQFSPSGLYRREENTLYLFAGADELTLAHELGHAVKHWAETTSPKLAAKFGALERAVPEAALRWAADNYGRNASADLLFEEAFVELLGRRASSALQGVLRSEEEQS